MVSVGGRDKPLPYYAFVFSETEGKGRRAAKEFMNMKKRIWELDALRGICILVMVVVHFIYDLVDLYHIWDWQYPDWFLMMKNGWGGVLFLLISGISATLGSRSIRRGLLVIGCGMVVSAVTVGMYLLKLSGPGIIIYFGVLQCLGCCMLLWALFKKFPRWALVLCGIALVGLGHWLSVQPYPDFVWLMPFGLPWEGFSSSDYFPLLPNFGWFLLGAALGRTVYKKKESLIPALSEKTPVVNFFCFCGRISLFIYMLHQPILSGICMVLTFI